jgi:hypothetical protein
LIAFCVMLDMSYVPFFAILTAIGFASVLTNSDVIFNVRDMMGWQRRFYYRIYGGLYGEDFITVA